MANKKLNAVITIGGALSSTLGTAIGGARGKLRKIGATIKDLEREQKDLNKSMKAMTELGRSGEMLALQHRYDALTTKIGHAKREQEKMNRAMRGMEAGKARMGSALAGVATVGAVVATAGLPVIQAASFETAMAGVAKQVNGARDASGKLTPVYYEMARAIQQLGREIPISTNELAGMVEAGARMGIQGKENLIEFTRTTAMMATALDLPREELSDQMGKIANLFHIPIPAVKNLGDAINYLDDNTVSKGGDIIDYLQRTGGVAGAVKVSAREMAALGSTLLSLGERTETAGTASNAFIQKLAAADKGTKKFRAAMDELGLSTAAVQKGMQEDAQGTILKVLDAVNKMPKAQRLGIMVDLVGLEHSDTLAKLSGNLAEYRKQIELVGSQKAQGSMSREFQAQLATTNAQWEIMKNRLTEVSVNIGAVLLPTINQAMSVFGKATSVVADFAREHPKLIKGVTGVAGAVLGSLAVWKTLSLGIGAVSFAFNALKVAMATNPIGLALVGLSAAAVLVYQNWEPISAFFKGVWEDITAAGKAAWGWIKDKFLNFTPLGIVISNWAPIGRFFDDLWAIVKDAAVIAWDWIKREVLSWPPVQMVRAAWGPVSEFFGAVWSGIKDVAGVAWEWIKGALGWTPLGLIAKNWKPITKFFSDLWAGLVSSAKGFLDWIVGRITSVGNAIHAVRNLMDSKADEIRAGQDGKPGKPGDPGKSGESGKPGKPGKPGDASRPITATKRKPAPKMPPMATARGGGATVNDNSKTEIHITQQPGQNAKATADQVEKRLGKSRRARNGGQLYDAPRGY